MSVATTITSTIIRTPSIEAAAALISIGNPQAHATITNSDDDEYEDVEDEDFEQNDSSK